MEKNKNNLKERPPIVVILGHVDHGKTTLLDFIRKANVVAKESGGITQHISAYQTEFNDKKITFIDTPGHEAFSQMRSRGANVADIAILIVAAEEGVKPQTKEVIKHIKQENIPVIIALNKIDKSQANFEKVIGELASEDILIEERGGKIPLVKISAKEGTNVDELLEMILLVAEMEELKADFDKKASGVVIESHLDSKKGATATFLVLDGTLNVGDLVVCGYTYGKIKSLENIEKAEPSSPVKVLGLNNVPIVGQEFKVVDNEEQVRELIKEKEIVIKPSDKEKNLDIILKADVHGSLGAILESLYKLDLGEIGLNILKAEVGEISESDIKTAYPSNALIIGFRVKASNDLFNLSKRQGVKIRTYDIIYELFEEIKKQASKLLAPEITKEKLGKLKVLAIFRTEKSRMIIGGKVENGKAINKVWVDVIRNEEKLATGKIIQLQHNKKDVAEVEKGREAGLTYEGEPIIQEDDILEFYRKEKKQREL
ncbi:translation initiation factor IF-2 [Patescibacteria group bacterium]|nr:translation initiation factor IF-2 [Patescibacteria group bacterium]